MSVLDGCRFDDAVLVQAELTGSSIRGAKFLKTDIRGCTARAAIVDGATEIWECRVDVMADFTGVGLQSIIADPATRQLLECNVRRKNWENWYRSHRVLTWIVKPFWWISDYGLSTGRIVAVFFVLALAFAALYYVSALAFPPGFVNSLLEGKEGAVPGWLAPIRAICYSIVTMTTFGLGGIDVNCQSFWGHVLLTIQTLLGYVLLGALVTRFAVLFTAGGPAGRFAEDE